MDQNLRIKLIVGLLIIIGSAYFFSFAGVDELINPTRVDSMYVKVQEIDYNTHQGQSDNKRNTHFYYSPADFNMPYNELEVKTIDSLILKGWYISSNDRNNHTTILIIHDLNESRITSLLAAKQFNERGY